MICLRGSKTNGVDGIIFLDDIINILQTERGNQIWNQCNRCLWIYPSYLSARVAPLFDYIGHTKSGSLSASHNLDEPLHCRDSSENTTPQTLLSSLTLRYLWGIALGKSVALEVTTNAKEEQKIWTRKLAFVQKEWPSNRAAPRFIWVFIIFWQICQHCSWAELVSHLGTSVVGW